MADEKQITLKYPNKWIKDTINPFLDKINVDRVPKMTLRELFYTSANEYIQNNSQSKKA